MEEMNGSMAGFGIVAHGVDQMLADRRSKTSYLREKSLMNKQYEMNMAATKAAPSMQVEGLRMAGFNPAMVAGAGSSPAPTVSKGTADMAQTIPFDAAGIAQLNLIQAQKDNIEANTAKINEEKRGTEQVNDIRDTANDAAAQSYIENVDREINDLNAALRKGNLSEDKRVEIENRIAALEESKAKVQDPNFRGALGIAEGMKSGADQAKANMDMVENYLNGRLNIETLRKKLGNGTAEFLARMPRETWRKLANDITHVKQLIAESESKEKLNDQQILKLQTDIEQIGDTVLRARLSDENYVRNMISAAEAAIKANPNDENAKRELNFWKNGLDNLTDTEFRKLKYDVGAGVVKGVATGGALGAASSIANQILGNKKNVTNSKYDWNGSGFEDGNIRKEKPIDTPAGSTSIGEKPENMSQFEWNKLQEEANRKSKEKMRRSSYYSGGVSSFRFA